MDVDNLVPIPRVSEKPLDSLDSILETSKTTITDPLFDFDSEFTLNLDNPILNIQNKESDESGTETIMDKKLLNDDPSSPLPPKELYFEDLKVIQSSIDTSLDFEDDYYDSEGDIIYLESLLIKDTTYNLPPEYGQSLQYLNCGKCGGPHEDYQCQPWHQNYSELNPGYDSNSYGFDQPSQYSIDHQPQIIQEDQPWISDKLMKSHNELFESVRSMFEEFRQREQVANLNTHTPEPSRNFNSIYYDDDDDEESTIPLNEIVSQIPPSIAITPVLPTLEPEDSLIMGDEDLSTISKKESDEVIKSSVEDLVPIPSESEDTSGGDSECDLPSCNDFSPINVSEEKFVTFSNPLFDSNGDFTSSDDESLSDEDFL
ncbi:hypothetical protein Tco_0840823 [Tanacetum coccineum]|uniref:Uncharacterized protein n=1 Tax=Tanacetum coccineum TaxID=301880 RepID=A0ABQ5AYZ9_9ASTR